MNTENQQQEWYIYHLFIAFFIVFAVMFCTVYLSRPLRETNFPECIISFSLIIISFLAGNIYLLRKYPIDSLNIGFEKENIKKTICYGGIAGLLLSFPLLRFLQGVGQGQYKYVTYFPASTGYLLTSAILMIFIIPVVEEFFWRAGVYRILKNKIDVFWGAIISSFIFALGHEASTLNEFIRKLIFSLVCVYVFQKTKLIGSAIVTHIIFNLVWFLINYHVLINTAQQVN